jgi:4-carboxymuconolactone decarboxylase
VPLAQAQGVAPSAIVDLAAGRRPVTMTDEEAIIFDFCTQLYRDRGVSDALYAAALELLGEQSVIELCALCGYYSLLSMVMNVARTHAPGPFPFSDV